MTTPPLKLDYLLPEHLTIAVATVYTKNTGEVYPPRDSVAWTINSIFRSLLVMMVTTEWSKESHADATCFPYNENAVIRIYEYLRTKPTTKPSATESELEEA